MSVDVLPCCSRQHPLSEEHQFLGAVQGPGEDSGRDDGHHPTRHLRVRNTGELRVRQGVGRVPAGGAQGLHRDRF